MFSRKSAGTGEAEPMPLASQSVNGKNMDCGEGTLSAIFAPFYSSLHHLLKCIPESNHIFLHLYSTPHLSSCTESMWCAGGVHERLEEEKGIGESGRKKGLGSEESPARTSEKGAGGCNGAEKSWGHLWEISISPGVRSPPLLLQEGMFTKSTWKLQPSAWK